MIKRVVVIAVVLLCGWLWASDVRSHRRTATIPHSDGKVLAPFEQLGRGLVAISNGIERAVTTARRENGK